MAKSRKSELCSYVPCRKQLGAKAYQIVRRGNPHEDKKFCSMNCVMVYAQTTFQGEHPVTEHFSSGKCANGYRLHTVSIDRIPLSYESSEMRNGNGEKNERWAVIRTDEHGNRYLVKWGMRWKREAHVHIELTLGRQQKLHSQLYSPLSYQAGITVGELLQRYNLLYP